MLVERLPRDGLELVDDVAPEMRTFGVSLVSSNPTHAVDRFYKYRAEHLPAEGEVIGIVRFLRGRVIRARVTRVDAHTNPQIDATQID